MYQNILDAIQKLLEFMTRFFDIFMGNELFGQAAERAEQASEGE